MDNVKDITLAYIAGLFDGDGSIYICKAPPRKSKFPSHFLVMSIHSSRLDIIYWLKETFGGYIRKGSNNKHQVLIWTKSAIQGRVFLELIYPYLRMKKEQAKFAIEFQKEKESKNRKALTLKEIRK